MYWFLSGQYLAFESSLPIYTGSERIASDFVYNDVQSGFTVLYYWSPDAIEYVHRYYERFATESDKSNLGMILHEQLNDGYAGVSCYSWPTENPACIEVTLIDLHKSDAVSLPDILMVRGISLYQHTAQPQMLENRRGGTLIIFGYYTPEM